MRHVASESRATLARPSGDTWGYWIPEPSLLVNSESRRERYILNWLRVRPGWLYVLRIRGSVPTRVPPQWWRDFLFELSQPPSTHDNQTRTSKRRILVDQVFHDVFDDKEVALDHQYPVSWFHHRVSRLHDDLCRLIVWELFELGFRHELLAMDRLLVPNTRIDAAEAERDELLAGVFPNRDLYSVAVLPSEGGACTGLCASNIIHRTTALESLRRVVSRWPRCPDRIRSSRPLGTATPRSMLEGLEGDIILFYVQTFFQNAGRAPIVPHMFPL